MEVGVGDPDGSSWEKNGPAASRKALPWGSQKRTLKSWSDVKLPHNPNQVGSKPENSNTSDWQSFFSFPVWISVQSPCQNNVRATISYHHTQWVHSRPFFWCCSVSFHAPVGTSRVSYRAAQCRSRQAPIERRSKQECPTERLRHVDGPFKIHRCAPAALDGKERWLLVVKTQRVL